MRPWNALGGLLLTRSATEACTPRQRPAVDADDGALRGCDRQPSLEDHQQRRRVGDSPESQVLPAGTVVKAQSWRQV